MHRSVKIFKRALDLVAGGVGLAVTAPLFPLIAVAVYIDSPGPIFFRQRRAGQLLPDQDSPENGAARARFREFHMLKFRSMRPDNNNVGPVLATEDDPRITRVGRFLRKTRLDELPQFINVLLGEMSVVGPRPEQPELAEQLAMTIPYFEERMRGVKPGITGLAQISLGYSGKPRAGSEIAAFEKDLTNPFKMEGAEEALADDMRFKLLFDLAYCAAAERLGTFLPLELSILVKTPMVMFLGRGT